MGPSDPALGNVGLHGIGDSPAMFPPHPGQGFVESSRRQQLFRCAQRVLEPVGPLRLQGQELIEVAAGVGDRLSDGDIPIFLAGCL